MQKKLVLLIILAIAAVFVFSILPKQSSTPKPSSSSEKQLVEGLADALSVTPEIHSYEYADWVEDGQMLPLIGYNFFVGTTTINGIGKYEELESKSDDLLQINLRNLNPLLTTTDAYFVSKGFTKSTPNTKLIETVQFIGYENGPTKCWIRIDQQTDPFGNFFCGSVDEGQRVLQEDFYDLFPPNDPDGIISFRVRKVEGNYALGSATAIFTGYMWIAKKEHDTWQIVWRGNDMATCTDMDKYQVPRSIYNTCYDEATKSERYP